MQHKRKRTLSKQDSEQMERKRTEDSEQKENEQALEKIPNSQPQQASLQHYFDNPWMYAERQDPESLNWGGWMDSNQLQTKGFKANRVTVPSDHDYQGICQK
jgi:hypothetical protein